MINVLIVDDDKLARTGLANTIEWSDYNMRVIGQAANGKKALEIISQEQVNLVFVDIGMPVMNGIELIRKCREDYPDIEFVVLSFHEDFVYVQEALRLGVIDYISKEKMERENTRDIMERVSSRINGSVADSDESMALTKLFQDILWLYDNMRFSEVLMAVDKCSKKIRAAERETVAGVSYACTLTGVLGRSISAVNSVSELTKVLKDTREHLVKEILRQNDTPYSRAMTVAKLVWEKFGTNINSKDVAEEIGLSRSHFSQLFQKTVGIPFNIFLRRERIWNACRLIRTTDMSMTKTSEAVGYLDIKNFNAAFISIMKCSPGEYRTSVKKLSESRLK